MHLHHHLNYFARLQFRFVQIQIQSKNNFINQGNRIINEDILDQQKEVNFHLIENVL
jgi:hypothetical protein